MSSQKSDLSENETQGPGAAVHDGVRRERNGSLSHGEQLSLSQNASAAFVPTRTSSAPPDEHSNQRGMPHGTFYPTKTNTGFTNVSVAEIPNRMPVAPSLLTEPVSERPANPAPPSPEMTNLGGGYSNPRGPQPGTTPLQSAPQFGRPLQQQQQHYTYGTYMSHGTYPFGPGIVPGMHDMQQASMGYGHPPYFTGPPAHQTIASDPRGYVASLQPPNRSERVAAVQKKFSITKGGKEVNMNEFVGEDISSSSTYATSSNVASSTSIPVSSISPQTSSVLPPRERNTSIDYTDKESLVAAVAKLVNSKTAPLHPVSIPTTEVFSALSTTTTSASTASQYAKEAQNASSRGGEPEGVDVSRTKNVEEIPRKYSTEYAADHVSSSIEIFTSKNKFESTSTLTSTVGSVESIESADRDMTQLSPTLISDSLDRSGAANVIHAIQSCGEFIESSKDEDDNSTVQMSVSNTSLASCVTDEDEWEPLKIEAKPSISLRPGGGLMPPRRLNDGPNDRLCYSKSDLVAMRAVKIDRPSSLICYASIVRIDAQGRRVFPPPPKDAMGSSDIKQHSRPLPIHQGMNQYPDSRDWKRGQPTRDHVPPHNKRNKLPVKRPQRVITDVTEKLTREVNEILNKIAPQTFEKLSERLCQIELNEEDLVKCFVELVFEKAILEQSFSAMYASLCQRIDHDGNLPSTNVLCIEELGQFTYPTSSIVIDKDCVGPYPTSSACLAALSTEAIGFVGERKLALKIHDLVVQGDKLLKIYTDESGAFYGSIDYELPSFPISKTGDTMLFSSREAALLEGKKKNGFIAKLTLRCEKEFDDSVCNEGEYKKYLDAKTSLDSIEASLTADERESRRAELEEWRGNLKRRRLGNIRFVGELCKKGIAKKVVVYACIRSLLIEEGDNPQTNKPEFKAWKQVDEETVEALCRLLKTVGSELDSDRTKKGIENTTLCYSRLTEIAADKTMNSRIRFTIEEILDLRANNWVDRRAQEGPLKIEQVHQKAKEEALRRASTTSNKLPLSRVPAYPRSYSDARSQAPVSIMSRTTNSSEMKPPRDPKHPGTGTVAVTPPKPSTTTSTPALNLSPGLRSRSGSEIEGEAMESRSRSASEMEVLEIPELSVAEITKSVESIVKEFCTLGDIDEVKTCLDQLYSKTAYKVLIPQIISKFLEAKEATKKSLLNLIDALAEPLSQCTEEILEALVECEEIKLLHDMILDCKSAPQYLGMVIGRLVKNSICSIVAVEILISSVTATSLTEAADLGTPVEMIENVFNDLLIAVKEHSTSA